MRSLTPYVTPWWRQESRDEETHSGQHSLGGILKYSPCGRGGGHIKKTVRKTAGSFLQKLTRGAEENKNTKSILDACSTNTHFKMH